MSFSGFALLSQKSQFTYRKYSIVWLPRVKCPLLLCKAKPAWIKRSIQLRNFAALQSGGATQRNTSRLQTWLLIQKEQISKITLPQKNGSRIKMPSSKLTILVSSCWEKNYTNNDAHKFFNSVPRFLEIIDRKCCILFGPPRIASKMAYKYD